MCVENLLERTLLARVILDTVLLLDFLHEGIDLTEAHGALGDFKYETSAVVVLNARGHPLCVNNLHNRSHRVLN